MKSNQTQYEKVFQVADYFIQKSKEEGRRDLSNKKLNKLLYYSQAWLIALENKPLFEDEIQAWIHGPAIPRIYNKYKEYGFQQIDKVDTENSWKKLSSQEIKHLDRIWEAYGKYDAEYLELLSHSEKPWQEARGDIAPYTNSTNVISVSSMRDFYYDLYVKETQKRATKKK